MIATQMTLTDSQIAKRELARRELARRYLIDFCAYVDPGAAREGAADPFVENLYRSPHLELIADYLQRAEDGTLWQGIPGSGKKILLITTPPGHWKSSLISRKLPAWFVGKRWAAKKPHQVILTSYNASLATMNNARVLELLQERLFQNLFPIKLSAKSQSSEEWAIAGSPFASCKAAGVGGGLTGYHAAMAIVDDPIKDRRDANSLTVRQNLWDWWKDVLRTRLLDDGFIVGVWTRWTEDDPAGRLLQAQADGQLDERIVLLRLPALAETPAERQSAAKLGLPVDEADPLEREPGEALWPEKESAAEHEATKRAFPITFDSLYQGRPRPAGGFMVSEAQFKMLPAMPENHVRWLWATDFALGKIDITRKDEPNYTVIGLVGLWTPTSKDDARLVIGYVRRTQDEIFTALNMVEEVVKSVERPYPIVNGQANFEKVVQGIMRRRTTFLRHSIKNLSKKELVGDKVAQAQPWLELAHAGGVYVVQGPWNNEFFAEVETFPHGAFDDQIEMVSVGARAHGIATIERKVSSQRMSFYGR